MRIPETLGERIVELRERRGWTQRKLAEEAGVSPAFLSEVERDKRNVGSEILLRIADALNASLDYLVRGPDEDAPAARPLVIPSELAEAAEQEGWSVRDVTALLRMRQIVIGRRSKAGQNDSGRAWSRADWIDFHHRVFPDE